MSKKIEIDTESGSCRNIVEIVNSKQQDDTVEEVKELVFDGVFDNLEVDDIYGDLKVDSLPEMNYKDLKEKYDKNLVEANSLSSMNSKLQRENEILKKNIMSLYLTAKREIQRKDREIKILNDTAMKTKLKAIKRRRSDHKKGYLEKDSLKKDLQKHPDNNTPNSPSEEKLLHQSKRRKSELNERNLSGYKEKLEYKKYEQKIETEKKGHEKNKNHSVIV